MLRKTTLNDDDLMYLDRKLDDILLSKDGYLYRIKGGFTQIDHSNPRVSLEHLIEISEIPKEFVKTFQPYGKLRDSL